VSELRKGPRSDAHVQAWFAGIDDEDIHLSVIVIGELRRGVELLRRRDSRQAAALDRWLDRLVTQHVDRIIGVDLAVAQAWGHLSALRPASVLDTLLAATAQVHGLTLVTRNVRDVAWTGVACLNPFDVRAS
jgi:predicted nucleic acid-binding protein